MLDIGFGTSLAHFDLRRHSLFVRSTPAQIKDLVQFVDQSPVLKDLTPQLRDGAVLVADFFIKAFRLQQLQRLVRWSARLLVRIRKAWHIGRPNCFKKEWRTLSKLNGARIRRGPLEFFWNTQCLTGHIEHFRVDSAG